MANAPWHRVGTVTVTAGSKNVAGVDTMWLGVIGVGDLFTLDGTRWAEVESVASNATLVLKTPWGGATSANQAYAIARNFTGSLAADVAAAFALLQERWHLTLDELADLYTAAGDVQVTDPEGVKHTVPGWGKLVSLVGGGLPKAGGTMTGPIVVSAPPVSGGVVGAVAAPIEVPEVHVGGGGFVPALHQKTIIAGGYRQHLSVGSYRSGEGWGGGMFVGLGGSDTAPTEHFLLGFGGDITHSSGRKFYHSASSPAFAGPVRPGIYTLATLPSPLVYEGYIIIVTNAPGGQALCHSNGAGWISASTNAYIS